MQQTAQSNNNQERGMKVNKKERKEKIGKKIIKKGRRGKKTEKEGKT